MPLSFFLFKSGCVINQGRETPRTWILEIWWHGKQVFPPCGWTNIRYLQRISYLYIQKPVSWLHDFQKFLLDNVLCFNILCFNVLVLMMFMVLWCIRDVLHKYANEDVSLGTWMIGLDVEHVDDRSLCCGTPGKISNFGYNYKNVLQKVIFTVIT